MNGSIYENLESFHCTDTLLTCFETSDFHTAQHIKKLILSRNQLTKFETSDFHSAQHLRELNLSGNQLTKFDATGFREIGSLASIDLSDNKIESLQLEKLGTAANLSKLLISGNLLNNLNLGFAKNLGNLKELDIRNNPNLKEVDVTPLLQNPHLRSFKFQLDPEVLITYDQRVFYDYLKRFEYEHGEMTYDWKKDGFRLIKRKVGPEEYIEVSSLRRIPLDFEDNNLFPNAKVLNPIS